MLTASSSKRHSILAGLACIAVFGVTLVLVFAPLWRDPSVVRLMGGIDSWSYYVPVTFYLDFCIHHGEVPLWDPLIFCGLPFAASPQSALFYPPHLVRALLTPGDTPFQSLVSLRLEALAHLFLAFGGMYLFARRHALGRAASFTAACTFVYTAPFCHAALAPWVFLASMTWLPFMLLLLRAALDTLSARKRLICALAMGALLGVSLLGGFPQMTLYIGIILGAYAFLFRLTRAKRLSVGVRRFLRWDTLPLAAAFLAAVLVAAALLLPAAELASWSARGKGGHAPSFAAEPDPFKMLPFYLRVGVAVLACASITHSRRRDVALYGLLLLIYIDCFTGSPSLISQFLNWAAPFHLGISNRAGAVLALPLAMLAGFGVEASEQRLRSRWKDVFRSLLLMAIGLRLITVYMTWPAGSLPHGLLACSGTALLAAAAVACAPWVPWRGAAAALITAGILAEILVWKSSVLPQTLYRMTYMGPSAAELRTQKFFSRNNRRDAPWSPNRLLYDLDYAMTGYEDAYLTRSSNVLCGIGGENQYRRDLSASQVTAENHRGNLFLKRSFWLARQYVKAPLPPKDALFPSATTVYLEGVEDLPLPEALETAIPNTSVSEAAIKTLLPRVFPPRAAKLECGEIATPDTRSRALPEEESEILKPPPPTKSVSFDLRPIARRRMHGALCLKYWSSAPAQLESLFRETGTRRWAYGKDMRLNRTPVGEGIVEIPLPDFEGVETRLTVTWQTPGARLRFLDAWLIEDPADEDALIRVIDRGANRAEIAVGPLDGYRALTFLDAYYPGWKACVDGRATPIHLANGAFKAIVVPPGTHTVEFVFRPVRVYIGVAISCCTAILLIAILTWASCATANSPDARRLPLRVRGRTPRDA